MPEISEHRVVQLENMVSFLEGVVTALEVRIKNLERLSTLKEMVVPRSPFDFSDLKEK